VLQSDSGQNVLPQIRIEVQATYPQADPVVLDTQPVLGALMFALETAGMELAPARCERLRATWERRATPGLPPVHRGEGIKLVVVGGGSTYTPELIEGFVDTRERLALRELVLVDPDTQRLQAVGDLAQRMLARASREHVLKTTGDLAGALARADYVIAQFRVGGMTARIWDERIPLELGCIGQETVGAGGFACALRTVPVALALAREMERYCPSAWLINFTNPSGLTTEALYRHADIKVAGLCNVPIGFRKKLVGLGLAREEALRVEYKGLNHLGWFTGMTPTQILAQLLTDPWLTQMAEQLGIDRELIRAWGAIPNPYLRYYVHPDRVLAEMTQAPATRGEQVAELERELLDRYRDPSLDHKPIELEKRGGAFYSLAAVSLIAALEGTAPGEHVLSFPHEGVIEDLPADAVAELTCRVSKDRIEPAVTGHLPPGTRGLVQAVKEFEIMTIAAAVTGSPDMALLALSTHPLVPSLDVARRLLSRFREAHAAWLPPGLRP
ncbi:MAG TPA: 6-phospho-beta-glucosidase, partial [Firmicutes bacterium]|nr:6-phospho-beta-glucosidase [Bacillota bacterium]